MAETSYARTRRFLVASLLCAGTVAACSAPIPPSENELILRATQNFEERDYTIAIEDYDELLEQFPFSDHAEIARLRIAHAYFLAKKFDKAVEAFQDFERLHPTSPMLPFVEYTIGMAFLDQATEPDRDKTKSENAILQFERVLDRYPDSLYGRLSTFRIDQARENMALHELTIGDYYLDVGYVEAARARYHFLIEEFPATETAELARERLVALPAPNSAAQPAPISEPEPSGPGPEPEIPPGYESL